MKGVRLLSRFPAVWTPEMLPSLATALKRQPRRSWGRYTFSPSASRQRRKRSLPPPPPAPFTASTSPTRISVSPRAITRDLSRTASTSSERDTKARTSSRTKTESGKRLWGGNKATLYSLGIVLETVLRSHLHSSATLSMVLAALPSSLRISK